jgi:hypothetical protein
MARSVNRLTARFCETVKKPGRHWDGAGLLLMVGKQSEGADGQTRSAYPSMHWMFRYRAGAKVRDIGLGSLAGVSLGRARVATECRALLAKGIDPIEARRAEIASTGLATFWEAAEQLHASKKSSWRNIRHEDEWLRSLERYCKSIKNKAVGAVTVHDVLTILQPIWAI